MAKDRGVAPGMDDIGRLALLTVACSSLLVAIEIAMGEEPAAAIVKVGAVLFVIGVSTAIAVGLIALTAAIVYLGARAVSDDRDG
jgi:hypothetical protein